ncbi:unnamed protein product [Caenorhabditis bovis]|uniref:Uncharacterized protein n=1 Tax=Caenorhabditis bovis TaxID=2654633 RepID=A0A8S1F697_9PELO|nr:unnamed protein product [Caenorhabditis bovis]
MLIISLLGFLVPVLQGVSRCSTPNATTYLRSEGTRLMEFSTKVLKDVTLNECANSCSKNDGTDECLSFEYDSSTLQCSQHSDDGQPFGASVLAKASQTISFFQQICLLEEALCEAPYSFERYPQSILIGHAMKVETVDGLSVCLSKCLLAHEQFNFLCKSVIYYYETGECIMNRDSKFIHPKLFRTGVADTLVDYFENNCADISCSSGSTLHWVRTEEYSIDEAKDVIVESSDAQQCNQLCQANKIGEEHFPCKAFAYSNSKQECHLTAESSYIGHKGDKTFNLAPLSSGEYFEKYCLKTNLQCIEASFELVANRMMMLNYRTVSAQSQHECLAQCMRDGARCASVTYFYLDDECQLSDSSQFSRPDQFVTANFTDYFDKICDPTDPKAIDLPKLVEINESKDDNLLNATNERTVAQGATNFEVSTSDPSEDVKDLEALNAIHGDESRMETLTEVEQTVIDDADEFNKVTSSSEEPSEARVKAHLSTECRMSGITVSISFSAPTSGTIYIKDHFSTCHSEFDNSTSADLHIPLPREDDANPRCGGTQTEPAKWMFEVVVERNEMRSPSLITTKDKTFHVTCDYTKILDKHQLAALRPKGDGIEDETSERILMEIVRNGRAVTTVPLGAEVILRWTVINQSSNFGFFINDCIAERVGGESPHPEPLKIIYQGCPEEKVRNRLLSDPITEHNGVYSTKMKVFRFDGSRRVRIKCTIDVCVEKCPPVLCDDLDVRNVDSYGKKKKRDTTSVEKWLRKSASRRQRSIVAGTLTIIDEAERKLEKPRPEFFTNSSSFCVSKNRVELVVILVVVLVLAQIAAAAFFYNKCLRVRDAETRSLYSNSSGAYSTCHSPPRVPPRLQHFT